MVMTEQASMPISAKMKMHVAALGNDKTWPKCPSTELLIWIFINDLQEEILDLVATIQYDKSGGTTGHLGIIISAVEFAILVPGPAFPHKTHSGEVDYDNPTQATTVNVYTERRLENHSKLHVFKLEQIIEEQCKKYIMSCFHKDVYCALKDAWLGYINIITARLFKYLYDEYGDKTKKLQNKAVADLEEEVDLTGQSITPFHLTQEKLLLFLLDTEQVVPAERYIMICLQVIKKSNFINKGVLEWRWEDVGDRTVALFWPFIKAAHKENDWN